MTNYRFAAGVLLGLGLVFCSLGCCRVVHRIEAVSVTPEGTRLGNGACHGVDVSLDGRYVVFGSQATDLVAGLSLPRDTRGQVYQQIYLRDLHRGKTELVSLDSNGSPVNGRCISPSVSQDGRRVAFLCDAAGVVPASEGGSDARQYMVYMRDRQTNTTVLASKTTGGTAFTRDCQMPVMVPDGRGVWFRSRRFDANKPARMFLHSFSSSKTEELRLEGNVVKLFPDNALGSSKAISGQVRSSSRNGGWVAFVSRKKLPYSSREGQTLVLNPADTDFTFDALYLHYFPKNMTIRVSTFQARTMLGSQILGVSNTAAGNNVAFATRYIYHTLPGNDANDVNDVFTFSQWDFHHPPATYFRRVSLTESGDEPNGACYAVSFPDSRWVVFSSDATNYVSDDTNGHTDIFRKDLQTGKVTLISRKDADTPVGNGPSSLPRASEDGKAIGFQSEATNLVNLPAPAAGAKRQIYVRRRVIVCGR